MNQFFAAGATLILVGVLWGLGKRPKGLKSHSLTKTFAIAQRSLFLTKKFAQSSPELLHDSFQNNWHPPENTKERLALRRELNTLIKLGPEERVKAIKIASKWKDESVLSILKIGLRDSESQIVFEAAKGMEKFKCFYKSNKSNQSKRPARNVFLMR